MTNTITKITHDGNDYEVGITSAERTAWNGKQDALTAGTGIDITNNTISSTVNGIEKSALFPPASSTYEGRIGYDTLTHKFIMCDGTTWTEIDVVPSSGTTGYVLTKTANGYTWAAVSGGDVQVSSQANNILTSGTKLRCGTQANYEALGSYDNNTIYLTY